MVLGNVHQMFRLELWFELEHLGHLPGEDNSIVASNLEGYHGAHVPEHCFERFGLTIKLSEKLVSNGVCGK